jgi:hypothetical protein
MIRAPPNHARLAAVRLPDCGQESGAGAADLTEAISLVEPRRCGRKCRDALAWQRSFRLPTMSTISNPGDTISSGRRQKERRNRCNAPPLAMVYFASAAPWRLAWPTRCAAPCAPRPGLRPARGRAYVALCGNSAELANAQPKPVERGGSSGDHLLGLAERRLEAAMTLEAGERARQAPHAAP